MFHQPTSSLGWDGDLNFVIRGYGTQKEFSLPYSHLSVLWKSEKDDIQVSYETLSVEKDHLQSRIVELETKKAATKEREKQYQI